MSDVCRAAAVALVAGRSVSSVPPAQATVLRHFLRIHALSGLAVRAIDEGTLTMPISAAAGIRSDWLEARRWSQLLDRECERIGEAALRRSRDGRPLPILLKGASVAGRYRDPELRPYYDIDLLVPAAEVVPWTEVLLSLGYSVPYTQVPTTARRHQESVTFTLRQGAKLTCDLHACLFVERRAREVTYEALIDWVQPSGFPGLLRLTAPAQLVALALHLAHHAPSERRLIWIRDVIECAAPETASEARDLAATHDLGWVVERALAAAEDVLGRRAWHANATSGQHGLAGVDALEVPLQWRHLVLARELGPVSGLRYLISHVDPRRFSENGSTLRYREIRAWLVFMRKHLASAVLAALHVINVRSAERVSKRMRARR